MLFCEHLLVWVHMNTLGLTLFFIGVRISDIYEGVKQMKEMIVVAGSNKVDVCWLRRSLRERRYSSIPCRTAQKLIEELEVLPTCDVSVPLVIIEPDILRDVSDDLIARLSDFALDTPFLLAGEAELQADLAEIFEKICEYRTGFRTEQNPELAEVLKDSGVELTRS